jgi:threonine/homoserine/homoserine lactone efflux protein
MRSVAEFVLVASEVAYDVLRFGGAAVLVVLGVRVAIDG